MGKQIRRTITITLTETWTFTWAATEDAPEQTITVVQETPKEAQNEPLQLPISMSDPASPSGPDPPASALTPDIAFELQPGDKATQATASRKHKRSRRRRSTGKQSGM